MTDLLLTSSTWGAFLSAACFGLFYLIQKKTGKVWCNPLLMSSILIGAMTLTGAVPYEGYRESSSVLSWLLLPATVSLAVPLYEQWALLKKHLLAILSGIVSGVIVSLLCAVLLGKAFRLDMTVAVSFLPKSVTSAIGADVARELGGIPSLTVVMIILTGIVGNMAAPFLCRVFRLRHAVSRGIAVGTSAHAIGTVKALEMGEVEGAMSSLAIAVAGILTAFLAPLAAGMM